MFVQVSKLCCSFLLEAFRCNRVTLWSNIILKSVFRVDVNECDKGAGICPGNTYCVNRHDSSTFGKVVSSTNKTVVLWLGTSKGSYECRCNPGYTKVEDVCTNQNECVEPNRCPQGRICVDTAGSYECQCPPGQEVISSGCSGRDLGNFEHASRLYCEPRVFRTFCTTLIPLLI